MADLVVLAEHAAQGAAGEKDRASATFSAEDRLFPEMRGGSGDFHLIGLTAEAFLTFGAIHTAAPGTQFAVCVIHNPPLGVEN